MRLLATLIGAGIVTGIAQMSSAAVISLWDSNGDPASVVNVAPGGTFQFKVSLTLGPGEDCVGATFFLGASQNGVFTIIGRTVEPGNPFTDLTTANPAATSASPGLNPQNGADLGGVTPDFTARPPATYDLYTITLQVAPTAPVGTYQINARDVQLSDADFGTFFGTSTVYSVAVPEPVLLGTVAAGSLTLLRRKRLA